MAKRRSGLEGETGEVTEMAATDKSTRMTPFPVHTAHIFTHISAHIISRTTRVEMMCTIQQCTK